MKKLVSLVLAVVLLCTLTSNGLAAYARPEIPEKTLTYDYWNTELSAEERAADLISHMSLDEKIAMLSSHPFYDVTINSVARLGVATYGYPGEALNGIDNVSFWYGTGMDAGGASSTFTSTLGQASTWNPDLIAEMADMIGDEARAYYNTSNKGLSHWAPTINLFREPRWGRADESFSEDVMLTSAMGGAFVKGFQGELDDNPYLKTIATLKHYAANTGENTRTFGSSNMTEAELREYYIRAFENIVEDRDPAAVMASYNAINGVPSHANHDLLTTKLRETFGFNGFVIGDLGGVANLITQYGTQGKNATDETRLQYGQEYYPVIDVTTYADDSAAYTTAGGSLELGTAMDGNTAPNGQRRGAKDAVEQGLMTEEDINEALLDILTQRIKTGEFDVYAPDYKNSYDDLTSVKDLVLDQTHIDKSLEVAEQSIVMLENDGILPVDPAQYNNVVVVGLQSDEMLYTGYASVQTDWKEPCNVTAWQGLRSVYEAGNPEGKITYIQPEHETVETTSWWGTSTSYGDISLNDDMREQIRNADLVIYMINTVVADASEGSDRLDMTLPRNQGPVGREIAQLNPNTVIFLNTIAQYDLDDLQDDNNKCLSRALLWGTYLGEQQGTAIANTIFGKNSPSGKLTVTWYEDASELGDYEGVGSKEQHDYTIYVTDDNEKGRTYMYFNGGVEYPFGYGLTYYDFTYGDVKLDKTENVSGDDAITATVTVTNTGKVDANEVVELYVAGPNAGATIAKDGISRPINQLMGFRKVFVPAGESVETSISFDVSDMACWNEANNRFECDLGDYEVSLRSDCKADPYTTAAFHVTQDITENPKNVTVYPDALVAYETGAKVNTGIAVAMKNDLLYTADDTLPEGAKVTYTSSNPAVATVDENGVITTVGAGVCTISASVAYNGGEATGSHAFVVNLDRNPWTDVSVGDDCYDAAVYAWEKGIVGIDTKAAGSTKDQKSAYKPSDSAFRPDDKVTREELCAMLYNLAGRPDVEAIPEGKEWMFPYGDAQASGNYTAILWAYQRGIMAAEDTATFGVNDAATLDVVRTAFEQMKLAADLTGITEPTRAQVAQIIMNLGK